MPGLQDLIHRLEEGAGVRVIRYALALFLFVALAVVYDVKCFRNFAGEEAMDTAQLARNIAEGRGYTTDYLRPASLALVKANSPDQNLQLTDRHPDLANAPVYPYLLAAWMKAVPMNHAILNPRKGLFRIHQPELMIAILNQILLLGSVVILFCLARSLFDEQVAWLASAIYSGTGLFWRFSVSGLSTSLLVLILLLLLSCLLWLERRGRDEPEGTSWKSVLSVSLLAGTLLGLGFLTRYAFGWMLIPVLGFVVLFLGRYRIAASVMILSMSLVISAPWLARNYRISGNLFGMAGYALVEGSLEIPDQRLIRSLAPDEVARKAGLKSVGRKLMGNLRDMVQNDLPRLGGNWTSAFFLAGLMIRFGDPSRGRMRYLVLGSILTMTLAQALGRTHLAVDSPEINSENLLVLTAPLVFLFGAVFFVMLLEQLELPKLPWLFSGVVV
ncbi:MAG: glycosyltransferase family 39 protein, partial [Opitutaceae bacterium]|nr:glycosyltransferase family 39 protein [Verrucomicrobiales bacterium]